MSAAQIDRMLGVTYKTAWFMMHRIREAMKPTNPEPLGGLGKIVEADETFVGGKKRNRAYGKPAPMKMVVSLVERGGNLWLMLKRSTMLVKRLKGQYFELEKVAETISARIAERQAREVSTNSIVSSR